MGGASDSGPPKEVVITVEPPRESWRRSDDERHGAARNDASTLSEWLFEDELKNSTRRRELQGTSMEIPRNRA
jgi:hypothetical protein